MPAPSPQPQQRPPSLPSCLTARQASTRLVTRLRSRPRASVEAAQQAQRDGQQDQQRHFVESSSQVHPSPNHVAHVPGGHAATRDSQFRLRPPRFGRHQGAMKVLLARPHDFIVAHMRTAVSAVGLEPEVLTALAQLETLRAADFAGAVISLAATSSVPATALEVFAAVRKKWPTKPIALSGLSSISSARAGLPAELKHLRLRSVSDPVERSLNAVLYVTDVDLKQTAQQAQQALRAHFDTGSLSSLPPVR